MAKSQVKELLQNNTELRIELNGLSAPDTDKFREGLNHRVKLALAATSACGLPCVDTRVHDGI